MPTDEAFIEEVRKLLKTAQTPFPEIEFIGDPWFSQRDGKWNVLRRHDSFVEIIAFSVKTRQPPREGA